MLDIIKIKGLFNLYDYGIDLKSNIGKIHFLTAPNGYGKTTILDMVYSAIRGDFAALMAIPFRLMSLTLGETELCFERTESFEEMNDDKVDLDIDTNPSVSLQVALIDKGTQIETIQFDSASIGSFNSDFSSDFSVGTRGANIDMFLNSISCRYITDDRILEKKTDRGGSSIQMSKKDLKEYVSILKSILNDPVKNLQFQKRLSLFENVVNGLGLSNKRMEIKKTFGFRFVSTDSNRTIIPLAKLSSGEKHIIIQLCEILFEAQEGTLILIDEPELSLHMAWQYQYLPIMRRIVSLCGFQFLIATHSPQIFNSEWSITTDLFTAASVTE